MLCNAIGVGDVRTSADLHYEGARSDFITIIIMFPIVNETYHLE